MKEYINPDGIPAELQALHRWVPWRWGPTRGTGKRPKVPIHNSTLLMCNATDPKNWSTFNDVLRLYRDGKADGVGFALNGDGIVCIDLDDCVDGSTGELSPRACGIVRRFPEAFVERSAGGDGLHIWGRGSLPQTARKKTDGIEIYRNGRFMAMTGWRTSDGTTIVDFGGELAKVHAEVFGRTTFTLHKRAQEDTGVPKTTQENTSKVGCCGISKTAFSADVLADIDRAIRESLPTGPGQRHRLVFELARALKAIPALADLPAREMRHYVKAWHAMALPVMQTKPFEETWADFVRGWSNVKFPKGCGPMNDAVARAKSTPLPVPADVEDYSEPCRLLVAVCRELQRAAGDLPFYLSCRIAGDAVGVTHTTANDWLAMFVADGFLECVSTGKLEGRTASEYRYRGPL